MGHAVTLFPTLEDVNNFTRYLERIGRPDLFRGCSDQELLDILRGANTWVDHRKWSIFIVATNYLEDGEYHP